MLFGEQHGDELEFVRSRCVGDRLERAPLLPEPDRRSKVDA